MNGPDDVALDRAHALMMAVLDGECSEQERRELEALLVRRADLAADWDRLRRLKEVTMTLDVARPPEEVWDRYRRSVLHRTERSAAWILIAVGGGTLAATALWLWIESWLTSDLPLYVKLALGAVVIGAALLLVSVVRERWHLWRRDPYSRGVER